ncbi:MAG: PD40 domain-containing protein, partial [Bdellovibrionales bacterium]|nr:PD40 domain-containing protein [Bdellovibrionales bacterium]
RLLFSAEIEGDQKIIFTDLATGKSSILVDSVGQDWFPVFHPEGKEIIFMSDRTGSKSLYRMNYEGNGEKRVSPRGSEVGNPSWVPDSKKRVAFYYREDGGPQKTNLFSLDLTTGAEQRITNFDGRNSTPKPAPNGEVVAYSTNQFWPGWDVCLYTIRTKANVCPLKGIDSFCRPAWNSAGTKILYSVGAGDSIALGEYDVAADSRTILSAPTGKSYDAQYVGNNSFIFANNQAGSFDLYFQEKDKISVIVESKYDLRYPSWHPSTVMEMEVERLRSQKNPK